MSASAWDRGTCRRGIAASSPEALARAETRLRAIAPPARPRAKNRVDVTFWSWTADGPESTRRAVAISGWESVAENYAPATRTMLDRLLEAPPDGSRGRLLLWHGAPGTGKTTALRALASAWRDWCDVDYITDPETFFGAQPSYMLRLLTLSESESDDRWRLLVLEDTGELMRSDAKDRVGQGLSRLLNLVDGLIGQGFRVLVLVTTNEPIGALHEAVARPGRCAAEIEFCRLSRPEAAEWLQQRGSDWEPRSEIALADLFGVLDGREPTERRAVGFVAAG